MTSRPCLSRTLPLKILMKSTRIHNRMEIAEEAAVTFHGMYESEGIEVGQGRLMDDQKEGRA